MPCTRPMLASVIDGSMRFLPQGPSVRHREAPEGRFLELPCGQCMDCRLRKARDWALRMTHEAKSHDRNCFLTLTYNDEHLPSDWSLNVRHWQLFAKRLRRRGYKFRFYHVGEYGERSARPHYHACIFGQDFREDRKLVKVDKNGYRLYHSEVLDRTWGKGFHLIGELTFDSACYVAKYVTKKVTSRSAFLQPGGSPYQRVDPSTGEVWTVRPEYATMSRGGKGADGVQLRGIGNSFFHRYWKEIYVTDSVVSKGREFKPPRYYDKLLKEHISSERYDEIGSARKRVAIRNRGEDPERRNRSREVVLLAKQKLYKGPLDQ